MPDVNKFTYGDQFGTEFQEHILAVMCRVPGFIMKYRSAIDPLYFVSSIHQMISEALLLHVDEFKGLPTQVTLFESIKADTAAGEDTTDKAEAVLSKLWSRDITDYKAVMAKAVEFGKTQAMVNAVFDAAKQIENGDRNVIPVIQKAQLVGEDIVNIGVDYKKTSADRFLSYITGKSGMGGDVIPTGIAHLDYALGGGLSRGEMGVILAPPKRGKSTALINLGFGAIASVLGYNVVHYTCEMSEDKILGRYDDRLAGPHAGLKTSDPVQYKELMEWRMQKYINGALYVKGYPTRSATPTMLKNHLHILASELFIPDLIIVDYADILQAERRLGEMRHEQAGIYEDLRQIAGEFNAGLWTGSQAPQRVLSKETLDLGDFSEAFEKAAIVDAAIAFCQTDSEKFSNECRLVLAGLRSAEDGRMVYCRINRARCLIKSICLLDAQQAPVLTPLDEDDALPTMTKTTIHPAVKKLHGKTIKGRKIIVKKKTKKPGKKVEG